MLKSRILTLAALLTLSSCQAAPATSIAVSDPWKITDNDMFFRVLPWEDPDTKCQYLIMRTGNALVMTPRAYKGKHYCAEEEQEEQSK